VCSKRGAVSLLIQHDCQLRPTPIPPHRPWNLTVSHPHTHVHVPGKTLISTSTVGTHPDLSDAELEQRVREHLCEWWGSQEVERWQLLRIYRIPFAQPNQVRYIAAHVVACWCLVSSGNCKRYKLQAARTTTWCHDLNHQKGNIPRSSASSPCSF